MFQKILDWITKLLLIKNKTCCACEYFIPYSTGCESEGLCDAKDNRLGNSNPRNYLSKCNCKSFKRLK